MFQVEKNLKLLTGVLSDATLHQVNQFVVSNKHHSMLHGHRIDLENGLSVIYLEVNHDPLMQNILEAHRKFIDLHYVVEGEDRIAVTPLEQCSNIHREYDPVGDYVLFKEESSQKISVMAGSYCYIPTTTAHMALHAGSSAVVKKLVFKIPV